MTVGDERFLPGRHLIDSFGNGGFRLGGVSHQGSLLITPSGVRALPAVDVSDLIVEHLAQLVAEKSDIDMVLIGTGREMLPLPTAVMQLLRSEAVGYDLMSTNAAVRTYNVVLEEERRVAAILIAVDKAYG
jgi:uncharacterized protein